MPGFRALLEERKGLEAPPPYRRIVRFLVSANKVNAPLNNLDSNLFSCEIDFILHLVCSSGLGVQSIVG